MTNKIAQKLTLLLVVVSMDAGIATFGSQRRLVYSSPQQFQENTQPTSAVHGAPDPPINPHCCGLYYALAFDRPAISLPLEQRLEALRSLRLRTRSSHWHTPPPQGNNGSSQDDLLRLISQHVSSIHESIDGLESRVGQARTSSSASSSQLPTRHVSTQTDGIHQVLSKFCSDLCGGHETLKLVSMRVDIE